MATWKAREKYVIVGGGVAGAAAVEGIRERDTSGSIVLITSEGHLPYHRPPLSKKLWSGQKRVAEIFVNPRKFYDDHGVRVMQNCRITNVETRHHIVVDDRRDAVRYDKLLLATGGAPRRLQIPGAQLEGINYFRTLDDYWRLRQEAAEGRSAVVVGGGYIGTEIAAALHNAGVLVTMVYPASYLCRRVFPESLGRAVQEVYRQKGVAVMASDQPIGFSRDGGKFRTRTANAKIVESDLLIVGAGIRPEVALAGGADLAVNNGVVVNDLLQTSDPDIYAAGDNACFPYAALGRWTRIEHWDNALNQGKCAGRNMAGAREAYSYMPYFFSDLFDLGYEAVGDVTPDLEMHADWEEENRKGVVYYLKEGRVRGALMCNVWDRVATAREMILRGETPAAHDLLRAA